MSIKSQASGDGIVGNDKGNRKRKKIGREAEDLRRKTSKSGVPAHEDAAEGLLEYLEDSEELKVGLSELKEPLETPCLPRDPWSGMCQGSTGRMVSPFSY